MAEMSTDIFHSWFEWQKKNHDSAWGNRCVKNIRMWMLPLVAPGEAAEGMAYLLGQQSLDYVQNCFQDTTGINLTNQNNLGGKLLNQYGTAIKASNYPLAKAENHNDILMREMKHVAFTPVDLLSKLYKINIAEMRKMGPVVNVISNDPTSTDRRKKDKALIENRKQIERDLSRAYTQIGQPPVKLEQMEDRFGAKPGNGNVGEFDALGLDEDDKSDVKIFMDHFHRLWEEMAAQEIIDLFMKDNEVSEKIPKWTRDMWAKNAIAGQVYVSETTGIPRFDYVAPETVYIYGGGRREDYNDANAKAIQKRVTVKEMLGMFGSAFDFEKDWQKLLQAITYSGGPSFEVTGIFPSTGGTWTGPSARQYFLESQPLMGDGAQVSQVDFMQFRITIGYVEWSSQEQQSYGNVKEEAQALFADNQPANGQRYQTKAQYQTPMYKSWYLAVTALDQILFEFGPQTYQQIEGYNDVSVNFTIITWKGVGRPLALQAKPHLDLYHEAFFKARYIIRRSKPPGTEYDYDSLLAMANDMFMDTESELMNRVQKTLQFLDGSVNIITKRPVNENGEHFPGQLTREIANGVPPDFKIYWDIMASCVESVKEILTGSSPLREGDPGGSRDSMNNQFKALEYSMNATSFIPDGLTYMFQQGAVKVMLFAQDIFQFKDHNTLPYNYYIDGVGQHTIDRIAALGNKAMHRFGIFVESLNQTAARAKLSARIDLALQQKSITNSQALLVERIESPVKAYIWLAYFEDKNVKVAQKNQMELQKQQEQAQQQQQQGEMMMAKMKIDGEKEIASMNNQTTLQQHANTNNAGLTKELMKALAKLDQIYHQSNANIIEETKIAGTIPTQQAPVPAQPPLPAGGPGGPPPMQNRPQSAISQEMQQAQPMPTSQQQ